MNIAHCTNCGKKIDPYSPIHARFCDVNCRVGYWRRIKEIAEKHLKINTKNVTGGKRWLIDKKQ